MHRGVSVPPLRRMPRTLPWAGQAPGEGGLGGGRNRSPGGSDDAQQGRTDVGTVQY